MRVQKCVKGASVAYPDEQTHEAITGGYCIPVCNMNIDLIQCKFDTRFRDESSVQAADLTSPPFTVVSGVDFHHLQTKEAAATATTATTEKETVYGPAHYEETKHEGETGTAVSETTSTEKRYESLPQPEPEVTEKIGLTAQTEKAEEKVVVAETETKTVGKTPATPVVTVEETVIGEPAGIEVTESTTGIKVEEAGAEKVIGVGEGKGTAETVESATLTKQKPSKRGKTKSAVAETVGAETKQQKPTKKRRKAKPEVTEIEVVEEKKQKPTKREKAEPVVATEEEKTVGIGEEAETVEIVELKTAEVKEPTTTKGKTETKEEKTVGIGEEAEAVEVVELKTAEVKESTTTKGKTETKEEKTVGIGEEAETVEVVEPKKTKVKEPTTTKGKTETKEEKAVGIGEETETVEVELKTAEVKEPTTTKGKTETKEEKAVGIGEEAETVEVVEPKKTKVKEPTTTKGKTKVKKETFEEPAETTTAVSKESEEIFEEAVGTEKTSAPSKKTRRGATEPEAEEAIGVEEVAKTEAGAAAEEQPSSKERKETVSTKTAATKTITEEPIGKGAGAEEAEAFGAGKGSETKESKAEAEETRIASTERPEKRATVTELGPSETKTETITVAETEVEEPYGETAPSGPSKVEKKSSTAKTEAGKSAESSTVSSKEASSKTISSETSEGAVTTKTPGAGRGSVATKTTVVTETTGLTEVSEEEAEAIGEGSSSTSAKAVKFGTVEETTGVTTELKEPAKPLPLANENTLYYSPYGECPQVCSEAGETYKERSITCRDYAGLPVPFEKCDLPEDVYTQFFEKCKTTECGPDYYMVLTDWSKCAKTCGVVMGDGTVIPNRRYRDYDCRRGKDGKTVEVGECDKVYDKLLPSLRTNCNSVPCVSYGYRTESWQKCSCDSWIQTRSTKCSKVNDGKSVDSTYCKASKADVPREERSCFPESCFGEGSSKELEADYCSFSQCSKHKGTCEDQKCACEWGFEGPDCQQDMRQRPKCKPPSVYDKNGKCCESGVLDFNGKCCKGTNDRVQLDAEGKCCVGKGLDATGSCSEEVQFIDVAGKRCPALDATGKCCESGHVDECGVCDGGGVTCRSSVQFEVKANRGTKFDDCIAELRAIVEDVYAVQKGTPFATQVDKTKSVRFMKTGMTISSGYAWHKATNVLKAKNLESCDVLSVSATKVPVCGNGYCEIGEYESCEKDCKVNLGRCEMQRDLYGNAVMCNGHGLCKLSGNPTCECFIGYTGDNCEECAEGFFSNKGDSRCIPGEAFTNRPKSRDATTSVFWRQLLGRYHY